MSSSLPPSIPVADDQRDENIFDQLKSIKAFTLDQLYLLHPDVTCPPTTLNSKQPHDTQLEVALDVNHDPILYQNLVEYEQLRQKLTEIRNSVKSLLAKSVSESDKVWTLEEESLKKVAMCQQDKIVETTFKFKKARLNKKQLHVLSVTYSDLIETIKRDYIYYSFESQVKRNRIATQLSSAYQCQDVQASKLKLKSSITTLVDFLKHLADSRSDFVLQCRKWLRALIKRHLEFASTDDCRFIIAQLCKGPAGTADWSADLIECKPYEQVLNQFDSIPRYITHCSALLTELFIRLRTKIRRVTFNSESSTTTSSANDLSDQNWSLIDPRFSCSEELSLSSSPSGNTLTELDVIKLCLRIPVSQIFRAYVQKCLQTNSEFSLDTDKNYEFVMLKLLTIGTIIIKTYQIGLEAFNSIQYGSLIEYLSSQIRRTVIVLSDQWTEFKRRLKGIDNALLMRLQVEYDNFMLRSILIILELRQCGIWRHLSKIEQEDVKTNDSSGNWSTESLRPAIARLLQVTGLSSASTSPSSPVEVSQEPTIKHTVSGPSSSLTYEFSVEWFKEVSEPMLWHILWQFYHSAFVCSCDYHSDNYWLEKFQEKSVIYLFVNKIRDASQSECSYLLNSITSMLLSRTRSDSKLVRFIATELFSLSFRYPALKEKTTKRGVQCLIRCAEKFPSLISLYLSYLIGETLENENIDLIKGCSLTGWICDDEELVAVANWLNNYPINSPQNKIARLILSKLLLNSPTCPKEYQNKDAPSDLSKKDTMKHRYVDLKLRRRIALLLYEASSRHLPEGIDFGSQSLGAFVEVAFGDLFCEQNSLTQENLLTYAVDENFQQFYLWVWRLMFTLELHILNQSETDWNDVRARSGTSRSIKNTVLVNDHFHPAPSLQDSECYLLSEGLKGKNALASYLFMTMTDITWRDDSLEICLNQLNIMAESGHLSPSLRAMEYLTICHLEDLQEAMLKDQLCLNYFRTLIMSNYDPTRLASLIVTQLSSLKQYRQLQLSQFYINILLEIANTIMRQNTASWFTNDELNLDKIAALLNYIIKFNFSTQRMEIIRKFYDCSYSIQDKGNNISWFGSFFTSNTLNSASTRREFLTTLHVLTQKFKKYMWLRWITIECDTLRLEKVWEDLVVYLSCNEGATVDSAIKKICPQLNQAIIRSMLPIYSWTAHIFDIVETDLNHPLCPLIWYKFFLNYFANSLNGVSVGRKLLTQETLARLSTRLDSLVNYHLYKHRNWLSASPVQQNSLAQLYKAYRLWLQDTSLQNAYVDIEKLREDYLVPLLKAVIESSSEDACVRYIDLQSIEMQNRNLCQIWSTATHLRSNQPVEEMIFVESNQDESLQILIKVDDEANDATSLILKTSQPEPKANKVLANAEEDLQSCVSPTFYDETAYRTLDESVDFVKKNFEVIFSESSTFTSDVSELERMRDEVIDLIQQVYTNKKREHTRVVNCQDGLNCIGPARLKFEVEEAVKDDRTSDCVTDRQRQCEELINEVLLMPSTRAVQSTIVIEENIKKMISDPGRARSVLDRFLGWIDKPEVFKQLNGSYYVTNNLLKILLELLSTSDEVDTYNSGLMEICCNHPGSVQIFSPHLTPSFCSSQCFLDLYKRISSRQSQVGPIALFVLLSKFDINSWLKNIKSRDMHHDIIRTTCSALELMGKNPDESYILTFELYRRHIHVELAPPDRRKFEEFQLLFEQFLQIMAEQKLCPSLWNDLMEILGLEKHSSQFKIPLKGGPRKFKLNPNKSTSSHELTRDKSFQSDTSMDETQTENDHLPEEITFSSMLDDITKLAEAQMFLDYHSLDKLVSTLSQFTQDNSSNSQAIMLERFQDYLNHFDIVIMTISFMWIKSIAHNYPDNHELIWSKFSALWYPWIFIRGNCQSISKNCYSLVANQFVACIRYMINKIASNGQSILRSVLLDLKDYVRSTKEVVYLELTILQRCLKCLPWASLSLLPQDIDNLASLSEQENYNVSDLVSHIIGQVNLKDSLAKIEPPELLSHSMERLATTIVIQSTYLKGLHIPSSLFGTIQVDKIERIAGLILNSMEYANLEHSQKNRLLVNLLRAMCIKTDQQSVSSSGSIALYQSVDTFNRSLIYAQFVSTYLVDLIKSHPNVLKYHKTYLYAVMDNSLQDLKILISPDVEIGKKTAVYENLLECCSSRSISEDAGLLLAKSLIRSQLLRDRPIVVMEVYHSIAQIISNARVLVYAIENLICLYLSMNGHYEKVWKSFSLKVLPSDLYLSACVEENAPLALLVYFEFLHSNGFDQADAMTSSATSMPNLTDSNKIWFSFIHWIDQLSSNALSDNQARRSKVQEAGLMVAWLRLLAMFEQNLQNFILNSRQTGISEGVDASERFECNQAAGGSNSENDRLPDKVQTDSPSLVPGHRALLDLIKKLISIYDSCNAGGIWSYLKLNRGEQQSTSRIGLVALAIACFLANRSLTALNDSARESRDQSPAQAVAGDGSELNKQRQRQTPGHLGLMRDECDRLKRVCSSRLDSAKRLKIYQDQAQFIETLVESANRNDKVQYSEGVQLITAQVKALFPPDAELGLSACIMKILTSLSE